MPSDTSRYRDTAQAVLTVTDADGTTLQVAYLRRRFLPPLAAGPATPPAPGSPSLAESGLQITTTGATLRAHAVDGRDRLDLLAWLYLGDPLLFWRVADVNACFFPDELTAELGRTIVVPEVRGSRAAVDTTNLS
jgi:hypothetical protein